MLGHGKEGTLSGTGFGTGMVNGRVQAGLAGRPRAWDAESGNGRSIPLNLMVGAVSEMLRQQKGQHWIIQKETARLFQNNSLKVAFLITLTIRT